MTIVDEEMEGRSCDSSRAPATNSERYNEFMADSCCSHLCSEPSPRMARYVYGLIFLATNFLAWTVRDYGHGALSELERLQGCKGARDCLGTEGVLRISLGCFMFSLTMFLSTVGTKKLNEIRDSWHSGFWSIKLLVWIALMVLPFLIPAPFIQIYGELARFGAGLFLLIQLISVISFITWLDGCCRSENNADKCHVYVMTLSIAAYVASIAGIVLMYIWYAPKLSCLLNIFFITWTMVLLQLMTCVALHSKVNAGFLSPGLMGLYVVFNCWCAIRSEPPTETCKKKAEPGSADWLTIISFIIAVLAMAIATFSTGIDSKSFQFKKEFKKEDTEPVDDVPYGYGFFHFVFAMGSMYFAMLLIGWNMHHTMQKWTIDVGWTSAWVRIVNEWLAVTVYVWMMVAPLVWKNGQAEPA